MTVHALAAAQHSAALLRIDRLNLLLPQADIRTLESVSDLDAANPLARSAGWITVRQQRWPVYCFSQELKLLQQVPIGRRACAMIAGESGYLGVLCDDVTVIKEFKNEYFELPPAMHLPDTPILHLAQLEQGIACVSNAQHLSAFIARLSALT